jgi:hypothetical protein
MGLKTLVRVRRAVQKKKMDVRIKIEGNENV